MMKKSLSQFLRMKKKMIGIIVLFCGGICAFTVMLEGISLRKSYETVVAVEVSDSATGMKNAERAFGQQVRELQYQDAQIAEDYFHHQLRLEDVGLEIAHSPATYFGVLEEQDGKIIGYYPWRISRSPFVKNMDEFLEHHEMQGDIHFFAHNFSNSRNAIILVHRVEREEGNLLFVYQMEDGYYWFDTTNNSLRNGFFLYDIALGTLAPSRTSFVNMTEVVEELKQGKESGSLIFHHNAADRLVSYIRSRDLEVYLFNSIPLPSFPAFLWENIKDRLPFYFLYLCMIGGVGWLFYRFMCRPVVEVSEAFTQEFLNESQLYQAPKARSVYSPAIEAVNEMRRKILAIRENEYKERFLKERAELIMLQGQINPHFMYNTLESIRAMATLEGATEAPKMVKALADFFRYTISKKDTIVTVQEELKNIEDYLTIQNYRFQNKFSYRKEFDLSAPYMKCKVIKMLLQPIVENAIFHGLEPMIGKGAITIQIYMTTKHLRIVVKDNGMGISPERLHRLNEEILKNDHDEDMEHSKHGIALKNVVQRIHLYFGSEYGIMIYSKEKIGTEVTISLPIIYETVQLPNAVFEKE